MNRNIILVVGESKGGKTSSLRNLKNPKGVMYLNAESNKGLPFKNGSLFWNITITDPYDIYDAFNAAEEEPDVHTIVLDTITMSMDMFESIHVIPATDTQKMWGQYHQFFLNLMQEYVAKSSKRVIFLAHVDSILNEEKGITETKVKVKGALQARGVEAYFNVVIASKCLPIKKLSKVKNDLFTLTDREEVVGFKYVFQTERTKDTSGERIACPFELFSLDETFIDNDVELVFKRINEFYIAEE